MAEKTDHGAFNIQRRVYMRGQREWTKFSREFLQPVPRAAQMLRSLALLPSPFQFLGLGRY